MTFKNRCVVWWEMIVKWWQGYKITNLTVMVLMLAGILAVKIADLVEAHTAPKVQATDMPSEEVVRAKVRFFYSDAEAQLPDKDFATQHLDLVRRSFRSRDNTAESAESFRKHVYNYVLEVNTHGAEISSDVRTELANMLEKCPSTATVQGGQRELEAIIALAKKNRLNFDAKIAAINNKQ